MYLNLKTPCLDDGTEFAALSLSAESTLAQLWMWRCLPSCMSSLTIKRALLASHCISVTRSRKCKFVHTHILCELGGGTGEFPPRYIVS